MFEPDGQQRSDDQRWEAELGIRLEAIIVATGKDKSVQSTGRSWKQLQRYVKGESEVPVGVTKALADASGVSLAWLVDGIVQTAADVKLAMALVNDEISAVRSQLLQADDAAAPALQARETALLAKSDTLVRILALVAGRPRYPRGLQDYAAPGLTGEGINDHALAQLRGYGADDAALWELVIEETLAWLNRNELEVPPANAAGMMGRILAHMRGKAGLDEGAKKTEIRVQLDLTMDMMRAAGWKPRTT